MLSEAPLGFFTWAKIEVIHVSRSQKTAFISLKNRQEITFPLLNETFFAALSYIKRHNYAKVYDIE